MEMMESSRRHEDLLWRQQRKMGDDDPFGSSLVCVYFFHVCVFFAVSSQVTQGE